MLIKIKIPKPNIFAPMLVQQAIMCIGGTLSIPFIISGLICANDMPEVTSELLSITMFMCGIATLLQTTLGIRYTCTLL